MNYINWIVSISIQLTSGCILPSLSYPNAAILDIAMQIFLLFHLRHLLCYFLASTVLLHSWKLNISVNSFIASSIPVGWVTAYIYYRQAFTFSHFFCQTSELVRLCFEYRFSFLVWPNSVQVTSFVLKIKHFISVLQQVQPKLYRLRWWSW